MDEEKFAIDAIPSTKAEILTKFAQWDYARKIAKNIEYGELRIHIAEGVIKFVAVSYNASTKG